MDKQELDPLERKIAEQIENINKAVEAVRELAGVLAVLNEPMNNITRQLVELAGKIRNYKKKEGA